MQLAGGHTEKTCQLDCRGGWGLIRGDFGGQFLRGPKSAGPSLRSASMGPLWGWLPSTMVVHCGLRSGGHTAGAGRRICFLPRSSSLPGVASQLGRGAGGGPGSTDSTLGGGGGIRSAATLINACYVIKSLVFPVGVLGAGQLLPRNADIRDIMLLVCPSRQERGAPSMMEGKAGTDVWEYGLEVWELESDGFQSGFKSCLCPQKVVQPLCTSLFI